MKSSLISLTFLCTLMMSANSFAVQHITCFPYDMSTDDRAIMSLTTTETGTLYLTSGLDYWGNQENSGVLPMHKIDQNNQSSFYLAKNSIAVFKVTLPNAIIGRATSSFDATLSLKRNDQSAQVEQDLTCYSSVFN